MRLEFLCGCETPQDFDPVQMEEDRENEITLREATIDADGFIVCVKHKWARRKGWLSLPTTRAGTFSDFSIAGWTPLERERFLIFGEELPEKVIHLAGDPEK